MLAGRVASRVDLDQWAAGVSMVVITAICERKIMARRIATIALFALMLAGAASMLSACNTMEGAGQDIQQGGKALENSADRNK
jgi:entericidin B